MLKLVWPILAILIELSHQYAPPVKRKHLVMIMADDLGYDDVSFRGSNEIPTPNIDALAFNSVILNRHYTPPLCTPSRASLMTGKYPYKIGMQNFVIVSDEPWGLPKSEKILPQYLKEIGYQTALIGKWHLGMYKKKFIPTERGFDSFFGYLGPYIDYYDHSLQMFDKNYSRGYDLRRNDKIIPNRSKQYATDLFTQEAVNVIENHDTNSPNPLFLMVTHLAPHAGNEDDPMQAPNEEINKFLHIENKKRRTLAGMISSLDNSVGEIVASLARKRMLNDTMIIFYSDNGGPTIGLHSTNASNYPLRGQKHSGWEGAIRTNAFIFSPDLKPAVRDQLFHVSDILPTIASYAGFKIEGQIDGVDQWNMLKTGAVSPRYEIPNIDDVFGFGSLIHQNYKFLNGTLLNGKLDGWLAERNPRPYDNSISYVLKVLTSKTNQAMSTNPQWNLSLHLLRLRRMRDDASVKCSRRRTKTPCDLTKAPCLFNIFEDPCEQNNIAEALPQKLDEMKRLYFDKLNQAVPSIRVPADPACNPLYWNNTWTWWQGEL